MCLSGFWFSALKRVDGFLEQHITGEGGVVIEQS